MDYPATFEFNAPERVARWRVIGNIILSIPHGIVLYVLGAFSLVVDVFSWIAIVITGKLPAGLAGVNCMLIRYGARVGTYSDFMRSSYPPFDFDTSAQDNGNDPEVVVNFEPEMDGRSRLSVFFRFILLIPVLIMGFIWGILWMLTMIVGFFAVLILGRWPKGLLNFMVGVNRFNVRASAYWALLTDKFPPLGLS
ncbi:DUF4389 domain-containing protein [Candidatus Poriferisocius sp.]|uniref:DUF4389 domain-containing protein n=1 Tax=Candidatus Poriferisocius sp. TaxID=3101276 RepID=UPI003B0184C7